MKPRTVSALFDLRQHLHLGTPSPAHPADQVVTKLDPSVRPAAAPANRRRLRSSLARCASAPAAPAPAPAALAAAPGDAAARQVENSRSLLDAAQLARRLEHRRTARRAAKGREGHAGSDGTGRAQI